MLWMAVIYLFSAKQGNVSSQQSGSLAKLLASFFGGKMSTTGMNFLEVALRKIAHITEFAVLGGLWYGYFCFSPRKELRPQTLAATVSVLYAFCDEVHQYFVPGRAARWYDVAFDTLGIILGILAVKLFVWRYKKWKQK